jgi:hypothetical protein
MFPMTFPAITAGVLDPVVRPVRDVLEGAAVYMQMFI